jgi:hypothetical protein
MRPADADGPRWTVARLLAGCEETGTVRKRGRDLTSRQLPARIVVVWPRSALFARKESFTRPGSTPGKTDRNCVVNDHLSLVADHGVTGRILLRSDTRPTHRRAQGDRSTRRSIRQSIRPTQVAKCSGLEADSAGGQPPPPVRECRSHTIRMLPRPAPRPTSPFRAWRTGLDIAAQTAKRGNHQVPAVSGR